MRRPLLEQGFTLLEASIVIAILVTLAALLVLKLERTQDDAQTVATRALLTTLRDAFVGSATASGYIADMKHFPDYDSTGLRVNQLLEPPSDQAKLFNPVTQRGWRGPYITGEIPTQNTIASRRGFFPTANDRRTLSDSTFLVRHFYDNDGSSLYGTQDERAVGDVWGNPVVLQIPDPSAFTKTPSPETRLRFSRLVSAGPDGVLDTAINDRLAGMTPTGDITMRGDDLVLFLYRPDIYEAPENE